MTRMYRLCGPLAVLAAGCFVDPGNVDDTGAPMSETGSPADPDTTGPTTGEPVGECGDGIQDGDEQCDNGDANGVDGSFCRADCVTNLCGDGYQASNEQCDDANLVAGDGCGASCMLEVCGDGLPGPDESCDDGNDDDLDACTGACLPAACGDGLVHKDVEACDDGNLLDGDGCDARCRLEVCGDGVLEADELCDDGNLVDGDGCSATCTRDALLVFATSATYPGSFGGLDAADELCQGLAASAGLPGTYLAWLSSGQNNPQSRFKQSTFPYVLVGGAPLASDWTVLISGSLLHPIDRDETGAQIEVQAACEPASLAWTNTRPNGNTFNTEAECLQWSFPFGVGRAGALFAVDTGWTNFCNVDCKSELHLYCFEQSA